MTIALIGMKDPLLQIFLSLYSSEHPDYTFLLFDKEANEPFIVMGEKSYTLKPLTKESLAEEDINLAIFFKDDNYKEEILHAEDLGLQVIDLGDEFKFDSTIPLAIRTLPTAYNSPITAMPSFETQAFAEILIRLDQAYQLKRVSFNIFRRDFKVDLFITQESTDEELVMINEVTKILDNPRLRITSSVYPTDNPIYDSIILKTEFVKPFNMNGVEEILAGADHLAMHEEDDLEHSNIILRRFRRDLSVDSGIHFFMAVPNFIEMASMNLRTLANNIISKEY